jgi:hypothetical protein
VTVHLRTAAQCLLALILAAMLAYAAPAAGDDTTDHEELVGTDAATTDNVGPQGDTATGGAFSSKWQECSSARINKYHTRGSKSFYRFLWSLVGPADDRDVWLAETVWYRYCPNGTRPDKVKPLSWRYCHIHYKEGQVAPFEGIFFDSFVTDGKNTWDQRPVFVPKKEDGTGEGSGGASCSEYKIPKVDRMWFRVVRTSADGSPSYTRYTTATNARVTGILDTFDWVYNPGVAPSTDAEAHVATFAPTTDVSVGDWYGGPLSSTGDATDSALTTDTSADIPAGIGVPPPPPELVIIDADPTPKVKCPQKPLPCIR